MDNANGFIPDYLLIGHITHDVTPEGPRLGGTVSYGAHTAAAFGIRVGILTSARPDEPLLRDLPDGVMVVNIPAEHTTTFENIYGPEGRTQYLHHRAATLTPAMLPERWRAARLVHIAPLCWEADPAFFSHFPHSPICVTPQGYMRHREPDGLIRPIPWADAPRLLPQTHLTVMSEEDIAYDPSLEHTFAGLAPLLVVTRAERGGALYRDGARREYRAFPVAAVNPTGAGDVFATALHIALHRLGDLDRALTVAAYLAGQSVTREGFDSAPLPTEVSAAWEMVGA